MGGQKKAATGMSSSLQGLLAQKSQLERELREVVCPDIVFGRTVSLACPVCGLTERVYCHTD